MCIKDLEIYIAIENEPIKRKHIGKITNNYQRRVIWKSDKNQIFNSKQIILIPKSNWGFHTFNIYEIRVYK